MPLAKTDAFFSFVGEREQIRLRKEADLPYPWTEDAILREYKFTNVHRHHDRTSDHLRQNFFGPHFNDDMGTILMNCASYRYFGTLEFADAIGWTELNSMDDEHWAWVKDTARSRLEWKERVFTGAYVITNGGISDKKYNVVVDRYLRPLQEAIPKLISIAEDTQSWEAVATEMRKLQGFGGSGFMTKEVLLDTTYTGFWKETMEHPEDGSFSFPKDWNDWTPIGPGARRGAARVLGDEEAKPLKEDTAFSVIWRLWFDRENHIPDIEMCLHDVQFQLCEFDKYERTRLGQGRPRSRYRAPK